MVRGPFVFPTTKILNFFIQKNQEIFNTKLETRGLRYRVFREIKQIIQHVVYVIGFSSTQRFLWCPHSTTITDFTLLGFLRSMVIIVSSFDYVNKFLLLR